MSSKVTDLTLGLYRRQYASFIKGKRLNSVSLEAEAWFWRFHRAADDFGNADAEPALMYANTVGLRPGITPEQVAAWYAENTGADLLREYQVDGERYYHIVGFVAKQPAGKNGKRVRHVPESPWDSGEDPHVSDPGESWGIQVNPDSSSATKNKDKDNTHKQEQGPAQDGRFTPEQKSALTAFDQWSSVRRGYPLMPEQNETRLVIDFVSSCASSPPILRAGVGSGVVAESVGSHLMIPQAVEELKKSGVEFKGVKFAITCVKNKLEKWQREGIGNANPKNVNHPTVTKGKAFR